MVIYYPKYYYKLNYIKYFQFNAKKQTQKNYNYTLNNLQKFIL